MSARRPTKLAPKRAVPRKGRLANRIETLEGLARVAVSRLRASDVAPSNTRLRIHALGALVALAALAQSLTEGDS